MWNTNLEAINEWGSEVNKTGKISVFMKLRKRVVPGMGRDQLGVG